MNKTNQELAISVRQILTGNTSKVFYPKEFFNKSKVNILAVADAGAGSLTISLGDQTGTDFYALVTINAGSSYINNGLAIAGFSIRLVTSGRGVTEETRVYLTFYNDGDIYTGSETTL